MKIKRVRLTVSYLLVATLSALVFSKPTIAAPLLTDEFSGAALDTSRWTILDGSRGVHVSGGNLILSGSPDHKDVNSIQSFNPGTNTLIEAKARISIGGDYQKFGFGVNSATSPIGFYFDSWDHNVASNTNTVSAIVYTNTGSQFLNVAAPAAWGTYHDLTVQYLPNKVNFLVDNSRVGSYSFSGSSASLPVGLWNDRFPAMFTDKVEVNSASFSDVIRGGVTVNSTGSQMTANFQPNFLLTLDEAAQLGGFDHFNWANIVVIDPASQTDPGLRDMFGHQPQVAYFDAVPGGYQYQSTDFGRPLPVRDSLRWYLDEEYTQRGVPVGTGLTTVLDDFTDDITGDGLDEILRFRDAPCSDSDVEFYTALVGVRSSGTGTFFQNTAFRWGTRPTSAGCTVFRRDSLDVAGTLNQIDFLGFVGTEGLPSDVLQLLSSNGIELDTKSGSSVPEPTTLMLLFSGILGIVVVELKRYALV